MSNYPFAFLFLDKLEWRTILVFPPVLYISWIGIFLLILKFWQVCHLCHRCSGAHHVTKCSIQNSHNYCGLPEKHRPIACTWQHPLSYHIFSQGNLASGICMLIYLKKQNKTKCMYFYMWHISLVKKKTKSHPFLKFSKNKNEFVLVSIFLSFL